LPFTVSHIINTDVDGFWRLFFDYDLARTMLKEFGDLASFEVVEERTDDNGSVHRRIECRSNVELPALAKKLVGDGAYTEVGTYDNVVRKYTAQCIPKFGADKFKTSFEIIAQPLEDGKRCERLITVENTVKVFGLGGVIESFLEKSQREAHTQAADYLNKWLRTNQPGPS
jgi:hypothetical protein